MTIALLNMVILAPVTLMVRVSDRRDFTACSCGDVIDQNDRSRPTASVAIKIRPALLLLHLAEDRFISGNQVKPARSEALAQSITAHAFGETVCYHAACVYPSHHVGLSQTIWRSAARSILSILSLHFVNVGLRRWSLSITHETGSVVFPICGQEHAMCISQSGTESHGLFGSV